MFCSTDDGANWTAINNGLTVSEIYSLAGSGSDIYAGTFGGGVFYSSITEQIGMLLILVWQICMFTLWEINGSNIFAGTSNQGVFLSTNNGTSWTTINNGLPPYTSINGFTFNNQNVFVGTYEGMFFSLDNGTNWISVNNGLTVPQVKSLGFNDLFFAGTFGGVFLSTDYGATWSYINHNLLIKIFILSPGNSTYLFALIWRWCIYIFR